jgi:hypothetical protein
MCSIISVTEFYVDEDTTGFREPRVLRDEQEPEEFLQPLRKAHRKV